MNVVIVRNGAVDQNERAVFARRQVPLLERIATQGVGVTLVLFGDPGGLRHEFTGTAIDVRLLQPALPPSATSIARMPVAVTRLRSLLRTLDYDILEGGDVMPAIAAGLAAISLRRGVPVVYRRHHERGRNRLYHASRLAAHLTDRTIVSCEAMRQHASAFDHVPAERIEIATTGTPEPAVVSPEHLAEIRRELGIPDGAQILLTIAQLREQKGVDVVVRSLDHLRDRRDLHLVVAGSGPEEGRLRELARQAPLPVHFVGHRNDVDSWLALSDVVVIPSRAEAFGRVTLESMAGARPIVATRVGGLPDAIIEGRTGLLVEPDDPVGLASAVGKILDDVDLSRRLATQARLRYESHFTMDHMATAWREAWQRIILAAGGRSAPFDSQRRKARA